MLITLAVVLLILWALGVVAFHVTSGFIHLLLIIALSRDRRAPDHRSPTNRLTNVTCA